MRHMADTVKESAMWRFFNKVTKLLMNQRNFMDKPPKNVIM